MDRHDASRTIIERAPMGLPRSVLLAAAVGGAFGFGLALGGDGKAHASAPPADARAVLETAEERTAKYEALVKASTATWHQELTTPEPATTMPPLPGPKPKVTVVEPSTGEAPSSSPTVAAEVVAALREPSPAPVAPKKAESAPEAHEKNDDRADQEGDADRAAAPDPRRLAQAIESVVGERQPTTATGGEDRRFALQLASTGTEAGAKAVADGFKARGFSAVVAAAEVPGRGTVYRVRIGGLPGRAAAEALKARVGQGLIVAD